MSKGLGKIATAIVIASMLASSTLVATSADWALWLMVGAWSSALVFCVFNGWGVGDE